MLLLAEVFISDGGDEEGRVSGPLLNAGEVEEGETAGAAPHLEEHRGVLRVLLCGHFTLT